MNKQWSMWIRYGVSLICLLTLMIQIVACSKGDTLPPSLYVEGDIENWINVSDHWASYDKVSVPYDDETIDAIAFETLLTNVNPIYSVSNVSLIADDGFMISINSETLENTYLGFSETKGWVFVSDIHPINSKIKHIEQMIISKPLEEAPDYNSGINIIINDENHHFSNGELLLSNWENADVVEGITTLKTETVTTEIKVMKRIQKIALEKLVHLYTDEPIERILVTSYEGAYQYIAPEDAYLLLGTSAIGFENVGTGDVIDSVNGIIVNPPSHSVTDVYEDTVHYLDRNENVMILYLDGLSYDQYLYLKDKAIDTLLETMPSVNEATTVYKPVTNAGFSAMLTGKSPEINGVLDRSFRQMNVESIFDYALKSDKSAILVEGDISILDTAVKPILNVDQNGDGFKDDEIYESALKEIKNSPNLLLVHFHSIDEMGHDYGPLSEKTIEQIKVVDGYSKDLISKWKGKVIIVSDHGMHETADGGDHGEMRSEDMRIPYAIIDGGKDEK